LGVTRKQITTKIWLTIHMLSMCAKN
jgi:hypothetical protein